MFGCDFRYLFDGLFMPDLITIDQIAEDLIEIYDDVNEINDLLDQPTSVQSEHIEKIKASVEFKML